MIFVGIWYFEKKPLRVAVCVYVILQQKIVLLVWDFGD